MLVQIQLCNFLNEVKTDKNKAKIHKFFVHAYRKNASKIILKHEKKQALTIVKNNGNQNSKNYRKSGKGSYGASEKKWKL